MKKLIYLILLFGLLPICSTAQKQVPDSDTSMFNIQRNSFYVEILGNAGVISLSYERMLPLGKKTGLGFRVGVGYAEALTVLGEVNFLYGKFKNYFEAGLGYTNALNHPDQWATIRIGYRYQAKKGFLLRVAPMYIYNFERLNGNDDVFGGFWAGASIGYSF